MSRFLKDLNGEFGEYWKKDAEQQIAKVIEEYAAGKITVDENGVARNCIGRVLMDDLAEVLEAAGCCPAFSRTATAEANEIETLKSIEEYRKQKHTPSAEELGEMRAAFGTGTTVVDVLAGETITL